MLKSRKFLFIFASVMSLSLIMAACSPAPSTASGFPTGTFIKAGQTDYGLRFNADNSFSAFQGESTLVSGTYSADDKIFTETSNSGGCETNVAFKYSFDGEKLTFNYVGDPQEDMSCGGRYADFNGVTYTLSK